MVPAGMKATRFKAATRPRFAAVPTSLQETWPIRFCTSRTATTSKCRSCCTRMTTRGGSSFRSVDLARSGVSGLGSGAALSGAATARCRACRRRKSAARTGITGCIADHANFAKPLKEFLDEKYQAQDAKFKAWKRRRSPAAKANKRNGREDASELDFNDYLEHLKLDHRIRARRGRRLSAVSGLAAHAYAEEFEQAAQGGVRTSRSGRTTSTVADWSKDEDRCLQRASFGQDSDSAAVCEAAESVREGIRASRSRSTC